MGIPAAVCLDPSILTASNITETSANLSWVENGTATIWDIEFGANGFVQGTGTTMNDVTNFYTLTGLTASTSYDYYVRADCGDSESAWVGPYSFMTAIECDPPTNVQHALADPAACHITWDIVPNATKYDIIYRVKGTTTWNRIGALYNYRTLRYLAPNTVYQYRVRSYCGSWDFANATGFRQFNTANMPEVNMRFGETDVETAIISMSPNPAQNVLNIQFSNSLESNVSFQIVDVSGKSMYQKEVKGAKGLQNESIDVSSLGEGYYMVIMQCNNQRVVDKLVIVR